MLLLALACKTTPAPAEPTPPVSAPEELVAPEEAAPEEAAPEEAAVTRETITLNPDEITYDEPAGNLVFSPGSHVRSSRYTHYLLELGSVEAVLGGRPTEPVSVVVEITHVEDSIYTPGSPDEPMPDGGFEIVNKTGRIVSKAP